MAAQSDRVVPETSESKIRPIELLTENGFSIFRPWEIDGTSPPDNGRCEFLVRKPEGLERKILVEIAADLLTRIEIHTCGRVLLSNSFWIFCTERHLASYVWEHDRCPVDDSLRIEQLTPEDLDQATRWKGL
jgi:hypothetical protein